LAPSRCSFTLCIVARVEIVSYRSYNESPAQSQSRVCLYPGLRHYITGMQEPEETQKVFNDMFDWIDNRTEEVNKEYKQE
ncbi:hypothetical protein FOZ63_023104, partial [Perkinsus olseni]